MEEQQRVLVGNEFELVDVGLVEARDLVLAEGLAAGPQRGRLAQQEHEGLVPAGALLAALVVGAGAAAANALQRHAHVRRLEDGQLDAQPR